MKLSYNWLKDYFKCDLSPQQSAEAMTSIGIEVDGVVEQEQIPGGLAGVVVAQVVECVEHPDSDHLHVTKVDAAFEADTWFPDLDEDPDWYVSETSEDMEHEGLTFRYVTYRRK